MANHRIILKIVLIVLHGVVLTTTTGTYNMGICFDEDMNMLKFDKVEEFCCNGSIHKSNGGQQGCCGNGTYVRSTELCCGNRKFQRTDDNGSYECCGDNPYLIGAGYTRDCCGGRLYDTESLECCARTTLFDPRSDYCFKKETVLPLGYAKCEDTIYEEAHNMCCSSVLHPKTEKASCCGTKAFDPNTSRCCQHNTGYFTAPVSHSCCGKSYFNTQNQRCCNSGVLDAKPDEDCCGGVLMNKNFQGCCKSTIYNKSTHKCCLFSSVTPIDKQCCGDQGYDDEDEVCCDDKFTIKKIDRSHDACCPNTKTNTGISYMSKGGIDKCQKGDPPTIYTSAKSCGQNKYHEDKDLCCNGQVYVNGLADGGKCCLPGNKAFVPDIEICCNGIIYNKAEKESCTGTNPLESRRASFHQYGICTLCENKWDIDNYLEAFESGEINTCFESALKVRVTSRRKRKARQTVLDLRIQKNIFNPAGYVKTSKRVRVILPCRCKSIEVGDELFILTNIDLTRTVIHLGDSDALVPYSRRLRKVIKQEHFRCDKQRKRVFVQSIVDIQDYIMYKLKTIS